MTNQEYHADTTRISKSGLDLIHRSPKHYWQKYLSGEQQEPTKAMLFGSAFHSFVLEPAKFQSEYLIAPEIDRRTKDGKAHYELLLASGKQIISAGDMLEIQNMADAIQQHPIANQLLVGGKAEETFLYDIEEIPCKCRPDYITDDGYIIDIKTTEDASEFNFGKSAYNYRYHVQSAFYVDGVVKSTDREINGFLFLAVEKSAPYNVAIYGTDEQTMELGRQEYLEDLHKYDRCRRNGDWIGYENIIKPLSIPKWAYNR